MRTLVLLLASTLLLPACASTGGVPRPFPVPGGHPSAPPPPPSPGTSDGVPSPSPATTHGADEGYAIAGTALAQRGVPYHNGGTDPASGFDCSGLVQFVFAQHGRAMPRGVTDQFARGRPVASDALEPGDLVFFTTTMPGASHVGIAIGGDQFVHAPSSSGNVRVESLGSSYWAPRFVGARRIE
jgi:cell wall-associated NlpC family hydrolase